MGHPLIDLVRPEMDRETFFALFGLCPDKPLVALLPGSRRGELNRLLPAMLGLVRQWNQADDQRKGAASLSGDKTEQRTPFVQWVLPVAPTLNTDEIRAAIGELPIKIVEGMSYAARAYADAALVCSGTATLETAILGTPFAILYRMNPLTLAMARRLVKINNFGLANLVAGKEVAKELLQKDVSPDGLRRELLRLLDANNSIAIRSELELFKERLGKPGAAERVAKHMLYQLVFDRH
jgi:lipid-A-disaccharide synthase